MKLSKRNMIITSVLTLILCTGVFILTCMSVSATVSSKNKGNIIHEYSATEIVIPYDVLFPDKEETSIICVEATVDATTVELKAIAEKAEDIVQKQLENNSAEYEVPINTAPVIETGDIKDGEYITIDLDKLMVYVDAEYDDFEWDSRKRIKDIYILKELLVNQLGVAPTKAAAIIGNICCEDSFAGLTNSAGNLSNISEANSKLGNGNRGYGVVQWTASYRQKSLKEYYAAIHSDLSWELTSVIAETAYLYNELYVSGTVGDLSEDGDLEDLTGKLGCEYEAYANSSKEWYKQNGQYRTTGSLRYTYAKHVYELICEGM